MKLTRDDYLTLEGYMTAAAWSIGIAVLLLISGIIVALSWNPMYGSIVIALATALIMLPLVIYVYVIAKTNLLKVDVLNEDEEEE